MIKEVFQRSPELHPTSFVAETASVIGYVSLGEEASLWYGVVARGDYNDVVIGKRTNIQDNAVIHIAEDHATVIGDDVTVGHSALIHGCTVKDRVLIGMGAIILNGVEIGEDSIVAAGSLVPEGKQIPAGVLAMGSPAKIVRKLTNEEKEAITHTSRDYVHFSQQYRNEQQGS